MCDSQYDNMKRISDERIAFQGCPLFVRIQPRQTNGRHAISHGTVISKNDAACELHHVFINDYINIATKKVVIITV